MVENDSQATAMLTIGTNAERGTGEATTRGRELEAGRLVVRAVGSWLAGGCGWEFVLERARREVTGLESSAARQSLARAVDAALAGDPAGTADALIAFGGVLERHHEYAEAAATYEVARRVRPECPELMLHGARAHRKAGRRGRALALYGRVRESGGDRLARFSRLGEALLSEDVEGELGRVLEEAESASDREAAAVAYEERARLRRGANRGPAAAADYILAAQRYEDVRDRLRVAHSLADALLAAGDIDGAREALHAAMDMAVAGDRDHAPQRLRAIARAQGDEVGLRRYPPMRVSPLVSLMPARGSKGAPESLVAQVRAWRDGLVPA